MVSYKKFVFSINPLVGFVYIAHIYNMKDTKKKDFVEGMKHYKTLIYNLMSSSFLAISSYPKKRIFTNINYRWCIVKEIVFVQNKKDSYEIRIFKKDLVLTISLILAIVSRLIHSPKIEYINFEVLISLFNLMVAIKALEQLKILDKLAVAILNKCNNSRSISIILILLCFYLLHVCNK